MQKSMQKLDSRAVWLFFISLILRWSFIIVFLGIYFILFLAFRFVGFGLDVSSLESLNWPLVIISVILVFLVIFWIWAKLTHYFYRYELGEDGFRKENGVIWKKYVTIPYAKIQNVDIYRGLVARILGLSDLHIQTAGASVSVSHKYGRGAEGRLPGLSREVAEQLRDELINRARRIQN